MLPNLPYKANYNREIWFLSSALAPFYQRKSVLFPSGLLLLLEARKSRASFLFCTNLERNEKMLYTKEVNFNKNNFELERTFRERFEAVSDLPTYTKLEELRDNCLRSYKGIGIIAEIAKEYIEKVNSMTLEEFRRWAEKTLSA